MLLSCAVQAAAEPHAILGFTDEAYKSVYKICDRYREGVPHDHCDFNGQVSYQLNVWRALRLELVLAEIVVQAAVGQGSSPELR